MEVAADTVAELLEVSMGTSHSGCCSGHSSGTIGGQYGNSHSRCGSGHSSGTIGGQYGNSHSRCGSEGQRGGTIGELSLSHFRHYKYGCRLECDVVLFAMCVSTKLYRNRTPITEISYQFEVCERLQLQAGEGGISIELCGKERAVRVCIGLNWFHIRNRIKTFS